MDEDLDACTCDECMPGEPIPSYCTDKNGESFCLCSYNGDWLARLAFEESCRKCASYYLPDNDAPGG